MFFAAAKVLWKLSRCVGVFSLISAIQFVDGKFQIKEKANIESEKPWLKYLIPNVKSMNQLSLGSSLHFKPFWKAKDNSNRI